MGLWAEYRVVMLEGLGPGVLPYTYTAIPSISSFHYAAKEENDFDLTFSILNV